MIHDSCIPLGKALATRPEVGVLGIVWQECPVVRNLKGQLKVPSGLPHPSKCLSCLSENVKVKLDYLF